MSNQNFVSQRPPPPVRAAASPARLEPLEPRTLLSASLYEDVNKDPLAIRPSPGLRLDDQLIFPMHTLDRGSELWTTDGTAAGTKLLEDIHPGPGRAMVGDLARLEDAILFSAWNGKSSALWRTDGTPDGTRRVRSIPSGIDAMTVIGDHAYFVTGEGHQPALWRTDGTKKGTQRIFARGEKRRISHPFLYKRQVRFVVHSDESDNATIWTLDEREGAKPRAARTLSPGHAILDPHVASGWIYHATDEGALARTNLKKTQPLKDINGGVEEDAHVEFLRTINDTTFFLADDGDHGRELWRTDGTPDGTFMLRDLAPGDDDAFSFDTTHVRLGDSLFFIATYLNNTTVWKSDGTTAGTIELRPGLFPARELTRRGDHIYFWAHQLGGDFKDYYRSDGTSDGTTQISPPSNYDLPRVGSVNGASVHLGPDSGSLLAYDDPNDTDPDLLYRSKRTRNANPIHLTSVGDDLYFGTTFNDEGNDHFFDPTDYAIWRKSGNEPAQRLAALPGRVAGIYPVAEKRVFFTVWETDATGSAHHIPFGESHLWITDGTPAGTRQFTSDDAPLTTGVGPPWPTRLALVGDELFYYLTDFETTSSADEESGALWRSDGTASGTRKVLDAKILKITAAPDARHAYFLDDDHAIWRTDGRSATRIVRADGDDLPTTSLFPSDGGIYFTTVETDRTTPGQQALRFATHDGKVRKLVDLDLTIDGTDYTHPFRAAEADGSLFFATHNDSRGAALWITDSTRAGTRLVKDFTPDRNDSTIGEIFAVHDVAYFVATTPEHGTELWYSDGTTQRTVLTRDIAPRTAGSSPANLTNANGFFVFSTYDPESRRISLWSTDPDGGDDAIPLSPFPAHPHSPLAWSHTEIYLVAHDNRLILTYPHSRFGNELWESVL